jgi:hypothetical protein
MFERTQLGENRMSNVDPYQSQRQVVIVKSPKSVGVAVILTFFFGPLGMFYSTVMGGAIMLVVSIVVGLFTLGFGLFITHPICIIWGAVAANTYNQNLYSGTA